MGGGIYSPVLGLISVRISFPFPLSPFPNPCIPSDYDKEEENIKELS